MTGLALEDGLGWGWRAVIHPRDLTRFVDDWRDAVATGIPFEHEARVRMADGEYRWQLIRNRPLLDEVGNILKWYGTSVDIEDRKRAEEALRESEQRFRDYAETASDWLWETGPDHRFVHVSEQLSTIGISPALQIGVARWDFATDLEKDQEKWRVHMATHAAHKPFRDFRYTTTRGDGSVFHIATSGKPVFDPE